MSTSHRPLLPPDSPDWPCKTPTFLTGPRVPPRLVSALYVLLRDYVHPGDLEELCIQCRNAADDTEYTNPHLEHYARALSSYLTDTEGLESHDRTPPRAT